MTRVAVSNQSPVVGGLAASYTTLTIGTNNGVKLDADAIIHFKNATGGTATLTVVTPDAPGGNAIAEKTLTIPTASDRFYDLSEWVYLNSDGLVYVDSDVVVSVAALAS